MFNDNSSQGIKMLTMINDKIQDVKRKNVIWPIQYNKLSEIGLHLYIQFEWIENHLNICLHIPNKITESHLLSVVLKVNSYRKAIDIVFQSFHYRPVKFDQKTTDFGIS